MQPGNTLTHYTLGEAIGKGGMGVVYRAVDHRLGREVAIKVLNSKLLDDDIARNRFVTEARVLSGLSHPNIAKVYDFDTDHGYDFLVMELVPGLTLASQIRDTTVDAKQLLATSLQITEAIAAAHREGVIHRDIKPENIQITPRGRVKVLDFGLAQCAFPANDNMPRTSEPLAKGDLAGTTPYMAPEQLQGHVADERTDVYSLGVVLYEFATGIRPFAQRDFPQLVTAILNDTPRAPRSLNADVPRRLDQIIVRSICRDRRRRYESAQAMLADLRDTLKDRDQQPVHPEISAQFSARVAPPLFVGRKRELELLSTGLAAAVAGAGRVAVVTGAPGCGKSALLDQFATRAWCENDELLIATALSYSGTGPHTPYSLIRRLLESLTLDAESRGLSVEHVRRLSHAVPIVGQVIADYASALIDVLIPGRGLLECVRAQGTEDASWLQLLRRIVDAGSAGGYSPPPSETAIAEQFGVLISKLADFAPLVIILDDLQWADSSSLSLLSELVRIVPSKRILLMLSFRYLPARAHRDPSTEMLGRIADEARKSPGHVEIDLDSAANRDFVDEFIDAHPNQFSQEFRDSLFRHTRGNPLFTVSMFSAFSERGAIVRNEDGKLEDAGVSWELVPARVRGSISERIENLSDALREMLSIAAVEGELFSAEVIAHATGRPTVEVVWVLSEELHRRHHIAAPQAIQEVGGARRSVYRFDHVLIQQCVYDSLDEVERAHLHGQVGAAVLELYGAAGATVAGEIARHQLAAGQYDDAVTRYAEAGTHALEGAAFGVAATYFGEAIRTLDSIEETQGADRRRFGLHLAHARALAGCQGLGRASSREQYALARRSWSPNHRESELAAAWLGEWLHYFARGDLPSMVHLETAMLERVEQSDSPDLFRLMVHNGKAASCAVGGRPGLSLVHAKRALVYYRQLEDDPILGSLGQDLKGWNLAWAAEGLWMLGYPDQSRAMGHRTLRVAPELSHPSAYCTALFFLLRQYEMRQELQQASELIDELERQSKRYKLPQWYGFVRVCRGLALSADGDPQRGAEEIEGGYEMLEKVGTGAFRGFRSVGLAGALAAAGQAQRALDVIVEGAAAARRAGDEFFLSESHRLRGMLARELGATREAADRELRRARAIARAQGARTLELRAATSRAQLWLDAPTTEEGVAACKEVRALVEWFSEGFDTPDLLSAREILDGDN